MHACLKGRHTRAALVAGAFAIACGASAQAAEDGLSSYPAGAQTTYAAFMPAPSTNDFFGYSLFLDAGVRNGDGDKVNGVNFGQFGGQFTHFGACGIDAFGKRIHSPSSRRRGRARDSCSVLAPPLGNETKKVNRPGFTSIFFRNDFKLREASVYCFTSG